MAQTPDNFTSTELDEGDGGDDITGATVTHPDGSTTSKSQVAFLGIHTEGQTTPLLQLVTHERPLPTSDERVLALVQQIADDIRAIRDAVVSVVFE